MSEFNIALSFFGFAFLLIIGFIVFRKRLILFFVKTFNSFFDWEHEEKQGLFSTKFLGIKVFAEDVEGAFPHRFKYYT